MTDPTKTRNLGSNGRPSGINVGFSFATGPRRSGALKVNRPSETGSMRATREHDRQREREENRSTLPSSFHAVPSIGSAAPHYVRPAESPRRMLLRGGPPLVFKTGLLIRSVLLLSSFLPQRAPHFSSSCSSRRRRRETRIRDSVYARSSGLRYLPTYLPTFLTGARDRIDFAPIASVLFP